MSQKQYGSGRTGRNDSSSAGSRYSSKPGISGEKKPGYQGKKTYGDRPEGGYQKKPYGDRPEDGYQGKKTYGDRPEGGYQKKPYGNRPEGGYRKKPYGNRPEGGYRKKPYGGRPEGSPRRKPYEKPQDGYRRYADNAEPIHAGERGETADSGREPDELPFLILGRNAVKEAIKSGRSIDRVEVVREPDGSLREILSLAKDRALVVREVDRRHLDEICMPFGHGGKTGNHQGIVAYAAGVEYCTLKDILSVARERNEDPFVIVLDGILDPHNLGSIIRSAECAGAHGVVIGKRRSASVTAATVKASAGATEHVKIARVVNIGAAVDELKRAKLWVAGADMAGEPMDKQSLKGPLALVIGGEGAGIGKLVAQKCDFLVSIPQHGKIGSLNAGVAAGILMFEKKRQDALE